MEIKPDYPKPLDYFFSFDTWGEMIDFSKNTSTDMDESRRASRDREDNFGRSKGGNIRGFYCTVDYDEAYKLALDGWYEHEKEIEMMAQPIFDKISSMVEREDWHYDKEGMGIDIAKFVENEPDCWQKIEPTFVEGSGNRVLKIIFNTAIHSHTPSEAIRRKGLMAAVLIQLLEFSGYRVELIVYNTSESHNAERSLMQIRTVLKRADQPIDMGRMLFALAHNSFSRRMMFSIRETAPEEVRNRFGIGFGYGRATTAREKSDISIPANVMGYNTGMIEEWIIATMEKCGVKFHQAA